MVHLLMMKALCIIESSVKRVLSLLRITAILCFYSPVNKMQNCVKGSKYLLSQVQSFDGNSTAFKESSIISDYFINHYEDD